MDDEAGFLQAIKEHPDDDTTQLVYADWLEERGDRRAELVRHECAVARRSREEAAKTGPPTPGNRFPKPTFRHLGHLCVLIIVLRWFFSPTSWTCIHLELIGETAKATALFGGIVLPAFGGVFASFVTATGPTGQGRMGLLRGALAALCCCVLVCLVGIVFGGVIGLFVGTVELVICVVTGRFPLPSVTAIIPLAFFWLLLAVILASYLPRRNPLA